jgi:hypothetical protein
VNLILVDLIRRHVIGSTIRIAGPGSGPMASRRGIMMGKPWFAPKRFGYGATPSSREGWTATAVYIAVMILDAVLLRGALRLVGGVVLTAAFIGVAYVTCSANWLALAMGALKV